MMCAWIYIESIDYTPEQMLDNLAKRIGEAAKKIHFAIVQFPPGVQAPYQNVKGLLMIDHPSTDVRIALAGLSHYNHEDLFFEPTCGIISSCWGMPIKNYYQK